MRRGALALAATCAAAGAGIWFVHDAQVKERAALHAGVLRDAELLAAKVAERAAARGEDGGGGGRATGGRPDPSLMTRAEEEKQTCARNTPLP